MNALKKESVINWDGRHKALPPGAEAVAGEWHTIETAAPHIPADEMEAYAALDPVYTREVDKALAADGDFPASLEVDEACLHPLARMERVGMHVDRARLDKLGEDLDARIAEAEAKFVSVLTDPPEDLNLNSPLQVLHELRKFESWPFFAGSTDDSVLKAVRLHTEDPDLRAAIDALLDHREAAKLRGTYVTPIYEVLHDDVVRPRLRHTVVPSGRLSCDRPNLLAWPGHTAWGKRCRAFFTARPGHLLGAWDLDQIEARLLAHYSQDPLLLKIFRDGLDFHSVTANALLGAPIDQETGRAAPEKRIPAKVLNYLILYGGGGGVLLAQLEANGVDGYSREECDRWIKEWYKIYRGVKEYAKRAELEAQQFGEVVVPGSGRRRWLPGGLFHDEQGWPAFELADRARKQALNHKIQGAAADLIKRAMLRVHAEGEKLRAAGVWFEMLLQIHDELLVEFGEGWAGYVDTMMRWALTAESDEYTIEIGASGSTGHDWSEVK
jgi:DNA polymerase-1